MKKAFKILVISLFAISGVITALFFYFQKNIQPILISEINKSLAVTVGVDEISVTRIQDFPKIGIRLSTISVDERISFYNKKLIQADELNLYVNLIKLYQGKYSIDEILIRGGTINIADLENSNNYDIMKPTDDEKPSNLSFEIDQLKLVNCNIRYHHTPSKTKINGFVSSSVIQLKYSESTTVLGTQSNFKNLNLSVNDDDYINKKAVSFNTKFNINTSLKKITIDPTNFTIQNIKLLTSGVINYSDRSSVDIKFKNEKANAKELIGILPSSIKTSFENLKLDGNLGIDGFISGDFSKNETLSIGFDYELINGNLLLKESGIGIKQLNAKGNFSMPDIDNNGNSKFNCIIKSASNGSNQIEGNIEVNDFNKPNIKWQGRAQLDPTFISQFTDSSNFIPSSGSIQLDGMLSIIYDINQSKIVPNTFDYDGIITFKNIQGKIKNPELTIHELNAEILSKNNNLTIQKTQVNYNETTATINGYIENLASIFDEKSQSKFIGDLTIDNLNLNELIIDDSTEVQNTDKRNELCPIHFEIATKVNQFKVNDFVAESIHGKLISNKKSIKLSALKMAALDGTVNGEIAFQNWGDNYLLDIQSELRKVNIKKLFSQFSNFYQNEITAKNISGILNGNVVTKVILNQNYKPILPKIYAKSKITIDNGALSEYEPLKELSSFVNIKDLENVKFKTLSNSIEIFDQTIFIPKMKIENNALNLQLEGTHTFDNLMSYAMEISVAELLATKANWIAKKAEKRIERNKNGGLTAYVIMEGTPDDLKIKYDRSTVKENLKEEIKNEKKRFIKTLKGENTLQDQEKKTKNYDDIWDE